MVPIMKGSRSARFHGRRLAAPLVGLGGALNIIPAQWVHGGHHEPIHDDAERFLHVAKSAYRFAPPVLCMRTNQPIQPPANHMQCAWQLHMCLAFSPSLPWWERHCVYPRGTRAHGISTAVVLHQSHCCEESAPLFERSAKTKREPVRPVASATLVPIMKVT